MQQSYLKYEGEIKTFPNYSWDVPCKKCWKFFKQNQKDANQNHENIQSIQPNGKDEKYDQTLETSILW